MKIIPYILLLALVTGCSCKNPPAPPPPEQMEEAEEMEVVPETGGCNNEHLEGTCTFILMSAEKSELASDPEGTTVFRAVHIIESEDQKIEIDRTTLRIPDDREQDLREHFEKNSPCPCKAYIVRPPCNPQATSVTLDVAHPDYATEVRF
ncbi:MAG: hypothetical protein JRG91_15645 [Deltaproteobacteria bacterium]|nr:hypothetical protein [Deltaproteobacteria bacterium]